MGYTFQGDLVAIRHLPDEQVFLISVTFASPVLSSISVLMVFAYGCVLVIIVNL